MTKHNKLVDIYDKHYKLLMLIPVLMLISALVIIGLNIANTGDFINKGVSLKGGTSITVLTESQISSDKVQQELHQQFSQYDISVRSIESAGSQIGFEVASDIDGTNSTAVQALISGIGSSIDMQLTPNDYNIEVIGSALGESFFQQVFKALIIAFIMMALVVWFYFRNPATTFFVILAVVSDILVTIAILDLFSMRVSTGGIAAFLMLIGYSVDTDILLSTRVIKQNPKTVFDGVMSAFKTGMTMSATTVVAVLAAIFLTQSIVLREIMLIIFIGLLVDVINTWLQNAGLLRWYLERK